MRVAHKRNRHLRVLLWKWDTASRLSFRRTEHLLKEICLEEPTNTFASRTNKNPFVLVYAFNHV
jgi:hypothetical protein